LNAIQALSQLSYGPAAKQTHTPALTVTERARQAPAQVGKLVTAGKGKLRA
jgi:hypothetical protein